MRSVRISHDCPTLVASCHVVVSQTEAMRGPIGGYRYIAKPVHMPLLLQCLAETASAAHLTQPTTNRLENLATL